jgi:hypothetical protein
MVLVKLVTRAGFEPQVARGTAQNRREPPIEIINDGRSEFFAPPLLESLQTAPNLGQIAAQPVADKNRTRVFIRHRIRHAELSYDLD